MTSDDTTLITDIEEKLRNLLMRVKKENKKLTLKLNIKKNKNANFSNIDGHCFLHGRKAMTNLDSILKSRDNTLLTNARLVKAMVFPVVMCGCVSWTIKKAERRKMDAFEL